MEEVKAECKPPPVEKQTANDGEVSPKENPNAVERGEPKIAAKEDLVLSVRWKQRQDS